MAKTDLASGTRIGRDSGPRRSWVYWTIATVVLLAGFADLAYLFGGRPSGGPGSPDLPGRQDTREILLHDDTR